MKFDALVIGSGPNGLAAAIELARNGCSVCIFEANAEIGGGCRSAPWTLPGFVHDTCAAIHPLAHVSPFLRQLPLDRHGLAWVFPEAAVAHPLDESEAVVLERSVGQTGQGLRQDAIPYARLMRPFVRRFESLFDDMLSPLHFPHNPLLAARFGRHAVRSVAGLARSHFVTPQARALLAGQGAHSVLPLHLPGTAGFGLALGILGHANGWPFVQGGSQKLSDALASYLRTLGGQIVTGCRIRTLAELPAAKVILCDVPPRQLLNLAGDRLPPAYRRKLLRFRHGPGVFKLDWALACPIPWKAAGCERAATLHLGGTMEEIAASEAAVAQGRIAARPFVIAAQQSLFDGSRAPVGRHTAWGYCHVPNGCTLDMTAGIEAQIERFAPGFRDCILARHAMSPVTLEAHNANYIGGDIAGGASDLTQIFRRPIFSRNPYATPLRGLFLCSASTPPGGGVHGMAGYHAARAALRTIL